MVRLRSDMQGQGHCNWNGRKMEVGYVILSIRFVAMMSHAGATGSLLLDRLSTTLESLFCGMHVQFHNAYIRSP